MLTLLISLTIATIGGGADSEVVYRFDFRESQFDEESLRLVGSEDTIVWESIQREPQGLRMTLRADSEDGMVGVANRFPIRGDFEITASYEIVNFEPPLVGYGAGPGIYIKTLSSDDNTAVLARLIRVQEGNVLSAYFATNRPDGSRWHQPSFTKTDATSGVLRMVRTGDSLKYYVAGPDSKDFKLLRSAPLGSQDVAIVRLGVDQGGSNANVEVLWKDLTIRVQSTKWGPSRQQIGWVLAMISFGAMMFLVARRLYLP